MERILKILAAVAVIFTIELYAMQQERQLSEAEARELARLPERQDTPQDLNEIISYAQDIVRKARALKMYVDRADELNTVKLNIRGAQFKLFEANTKLQNAMTEVGIRFQPRVERENLEEVKGR